MCHFNENHPNLLATVISRRGLQIDTALDCWTAPGGEKASNKLAGLIKQLHSN